LPLKRWSSALRVAPRRSCRGRAPEGLPRQALWTPRRPHDAGPSGSPCAALHRRPRRKTRAISRLRREPRPQTCASEIPPPQGIAAASSKGEASQRHCAGAQLLLGLAADLCLDRLNNALRDEPAAPCDADNSSGFMRLGATAACNDWRRGARKFHVGTGRTEPTFDAGYTTAGCSRRPELSVRLFLGGRVDLRIVSRRQ